MSGRQAARRLRADCFDGHPLWFDEQPTPLTVWQIERARADFDAGRLRVRESGTYNCAGLVFVNRRGVLTDGLEQPPPGLIAEIGEMARETLARDGYRRLGPQEPIRPGDVVLYGEDDDVEHIGTVITWPGLADPVVNSKFGIYGAEYTHQLKDVPPNYGGVLEIWTLDR